MRGMIIVLILTLASTLGVVFAVIAFQEIGFWAIGVGALYFGAMYAGIVRSILSCGD